jgi:benzoate-CoA ligase family protein
MTLAVNLFDYFFRESSDRPAIYFGEEVISHREVAEQTRQTAKKLLAAGVVPGERVALLLYDSPEFIVTFLGVCSLGAIAVPINPALGREEVAFIVADCGAQGMVMESDFLAGLQTALAPLTALRWILTVNRQGMPVPPSLADKKVADFARTEGGELPQPFPVPVDSETPAFLLYTSGSTGEPKGAVHTHSDIPYTVETYIRQVLQIRPEDRIFSASRLPFAYGLGNSLSAPLACKASVVLCREKPTPPIIQWIFARYRPTIFFAVPVTYKMLLDFHREGNSLETRALRLCVSAGEALPAGLVRQWMETFGLEILDGIGTTEMLHVFISNRPGEVRPGSSGVPVPGYEVKLVDDEGNPVAIGQQGHLWVRGRSAARGYWNRPDATARNFIQGWVRTGDLYVQDGDGYYYHHGRSDDCFKVSGQWVSPREVEDVVRSHAQVRDVAAVDGTSADGLTFVRAFVVAAPDADVMRLEEELRHLCHRTLPRYKRPHEYHFLDELPRTPTGKLQRFKLRRSPSRAERKGAPEDSTEG